MKTSLADHFITWLTLISGLSISAVAVYYSVAGLTSIFAAAVVPVAIMGIVLELSKLVATVWLKTYWTIAPKLIRLYLLIAIAILMAITSMGIFGYLSRAHLDQAIPTGDIVAKVSTYDEKIKIEKDNIDANRKALQQLDAAVDQLMARSTTEAGAARSVQVRRSQQAERARILADIDRSQKAIAKLNEERAPIAAELRKVEAEVGPIKYIAAVIYGDNPDTNTLERAVRFVIIFIVIIFDPLAVVLLLASQYSFRHIRDQKDNNTPPDNGSQPTGPLDQPPPTQAPPDQPPPTDSNNPIPDHLKLDLSSYLSKPFVHFKNIKPVVYKPEEQTNASTDTSTNSITDTVEIPQPTPDPVNEPLDNSNDVLNEPDSVKQKKRKWKSEHPNDTLSRQEKLYKRGLIKELPWDKVEEFDEKTANSLDRPGDYLTDFDLKKKISNNVSYVQNSEQGYKSIWSRIRHHENV